MKAEFKQADNNATQMNAKERNQLLRLLEDFGDLFYGTLGNWDAEPVDLELNPSYKRFNSKYYPVPIIKRETFFKKLKRLVETGVLYLAQKSQYGTPPCICNT